MARVYKPVAIDTGIFDKPEPAPPPRLDFINGTPGRVWLTAYGHPQLVLDVEKVEGDWISGTAAFEDFETGERDYAEGLSGTKAEVMSAMLEKYDAPSHFWSGVLADSRAAHIAWKRAKGLID